MQKNITMLLVKRIAFSKVKLRQSLKETWTKINMIFLIKKQHTVLAVQIKYSVAALQYKLIKNQSKHYFHRIR